jgi:hypothetical protein
MIIVRAGVLSPKAAAKLNLLPAERQFVPSVIEEDDASRSKYEPEKELDRPCRFVELYRLVGHVVFERRLPSPWQPPPPLTLAPRAPT